MSAPTEAPPQEQTQQTDAPTEAAAPTPRTYEYSCRKCRHTLFHHDELVPHDASVEAKGNKGFTRRGQYYDAHSTSECTSYFLDPDTSPWVSEESRELHATSHAAAKEAAANPYHHLDESASSSAPAVVDPDTIYCTKCRTKIGTQHWRGSQCSCGAWVTPAFKIHAKAIDKLPIW